MGNEKGNGIRNEIMREIPKEIAIHNNCEDKYMLFFIT
jgi:hypothetical protein